MSTLVLAVFIISKTDITVQYNVDVHVFSQNLPPNTNFVAFTAVVTI